MIRKVAFVGVILCILALAFAIWKGWAGLAVRYANARHGAKATVAERLAQYESAASGRLNPLLQAKGFTYPLSRFSLVAVKDESILQLFAINSSNKPVLIKQYPILAKSGVLGPKLREGDRQIPEGIYKPNFLNPNSLYHLSLRLNYPNDFDRAMAKQDGRTNLGGDIMIHGKDVSIGCIAIGDPGIEEIFCLTARAKVDNVQVVIVPTDWRKRAYDTKNIAGPRWTTQLYETLRTELQKYPF